MHLDYPQKTNGLYLLTRNNMDEIAFNILKEYCPDVLTHIQSVNITKIASEDYGLDIQHHYITLDKSILGLIAFSKSEIDYVDNTQQNVHTCIEEGTIIIERTLMSGDSIRRYRFTLAHEFAHWILHRSFHSPTHQQYGYRTASEKFIACRSSNIECKSSNKKNDSDWLEWQADTLAASLLMPKGPFTYAFKDFTKQAGINPVNWQYNPPSKNVLQQIIKYLADKFTVSNSAVAIRIKNLSLYSPIYN